MVPVILLGVVLGTVAIFLTAERQDIPKKDFVKDCIKIVEHMKVTEQVRFELLEKCLTTIQDNKE